MLKKAQYGYDAIEGIITTLVIAGIFLGVGLFAMSEMNDSLTQTAETTVTNESFVITFGESKQLTLTPVLSITQVVNASFKVVPSTNYTWHSNGTFTLKSDAISNGTTNVTYTYDRITNPETVGPVNTTINSIGGISGWFGILIAIGVVAIILSVLFFVRGRIIRTER